MAQRCINAALRRGRIDVSHSQRLANHTFVRSMRGPVFGSRVERASVQLASRCDCELTTRL
eukprot:1010426-Lingulodinium_polyedra.AAC.1